LTVDIQAEGGVGDGKTSNTAAFVRAVGKLKAAGGGTLFVPGAGALAAPPLTFLTGPFNLTSHMTLLVAAGGVVLGSTNLSEWPLMPPMPSYGQGRDHPGPRHVSLIHGFHLANVTITGAGTIDGNGQFWWDRHKAKGVEKHTRGHLIECMWCTQLEVSRLTLVMSPFWTVHPVFTVGFHAHHLTILNPLDSPNTDGIDPDSTTDAVLHDNYIATGDDCYALKSGWDAAGYTYNAPTRNVTIFNGYCESPTSAGVCIGSEMSGGVADVAVWNMTFNNTGYAFRVKTGQGRGGFVRNLSFADSRVEACGVAFEYSEFYGGHPSAGYNASALPVVRDVVAANISGTVTAIGHKAAQVAELRGLQLPAGSAHAMRGIAFADVDVAGGAWSCSHVQGSATNARGACPCLVAGACAGP